MPYLISSAIHRAEYNHDSRIMQIWFTSGGNAYSFYGVPEEVYRGLITAVSAGTYYDRHVRGRYSRR